MTLRKWMWCRGETITHAHFFLIRERMARTATDGWENFAQLNSDLIEW